MMRTSIMLDRIESKIFLFLFFSDACPSESKSRISSITVAGAITYLATAFTCESDDSCFWNPFFFSIAFSQFENPFFVNAGAALDEASIPLWSAFKQIWQQAASLLSSLKPCCLKWSFCWILTAEGLWNFSAGMNNLIRLQRLDLDGWVVSLSFFFFSSGLLFGSDCLFDYIRLVHRFTHDKSVLPTIKVFPTCFRHLKQDLNSTLKFLSTCWRSSPQ